MKSLLEDRLEQDQLGKALNDLICETLIMFLKENEYEYHRTIGKVHAPASMVS